MSKRLDSSQLEALEKNADMAARGLTEEKIEFDMRQRDIRFDLSGEYAYKVLCGHCRSDIKEYQEYLPEIDKAAFVCGVCKKENPQSVRRVVYGRKVIFSEPKKFWDEFENTNQILVPRKFEHWLIGQEPALKEFREQLEEWVRKRKYLHQIRKSGKKLSAILKEMPGPYILMVGLPGTGKSLLIKIVAQDLERLYKEHGIKLYDVVAFKNRNEPYKPLVYVVPGGVGNRLVDATYDEAINKGKRRRAIVNSVLYSVIGIGMALMLAAFYLMNTIYSILAAEGAAPQDALVTSFVSVAMILSIGASMMIFPMFIFFFRGFSPGGGSGQTAGLTADDIPNVLVNNDPKTRKLYVDATVTNQTKLTGDIVWSAYGDTPGISQPHHRRLNAGLVHEADGKLLFWDEFKNLQKEMAIELLTILENGEAPIRAHEGFGGASHTASQNIESPPIPALFLLVAAANDDIIDDPTSVLNQIKALRNRFRYGNTIYMQSEVEATPENEIKFVQAITDEAYRFNFPPLSKDACRLIVAQARRRASAKDMLSLRFRTTIQLLKKAAQATWLDPNEPRGKEVIRAAHVRQALGSTISVEEQKLLQHLKRNRIHQLIQTEGAKTRTVNGLAVYVPPSAEEGEMVGNAFPVAVHVQKVDAHQKAAFVVTGTKKEQQAIVNDSIEHVKTAVNALYDIIIEKEYKVHVSFSQQYQVEGDSAGVAMTLALVSALGDPRLSSDARVPVPLRQDVAVTGAIQILMDDMYPDMPEEEYKARLEAGEVDLRGKVPLVGAIGGTWEKVLGAKRAGIKNVIVPMSNYDQNVDPEMRREEGVNVFGARNILNYFDLLRADGVREVLRPRDRAAVKLR